ncbi:MAG: 7-cyano-7-deazaguanine synthase QueC [Nitrososphaerales archaeon]
MKRALVLLSGGIDSATCLWWAKDQGWEIYTLSFNYYRRAEKEIEASKKLAQRAEAKEHMVIDLPFLKEVFDLKVKGKEWDGIPSIYIPSRNLIFYSIALYFAEIYKFNYIVGGHNFDDRNFFPDAKAEYIELLNRLISLGLWTYKKRKIKIIAPLSKLNKIEVIKLGSKLRVPFELTWSCHRDLDCPCNECDGCKSREEAFRLAGIEDPLREIFI